MRRKSLRLAFFSVVIAASMMSYTFLNFCPSVANSMTISAEKTEMVVPEDNKESAFTFPDVKIIDKILQVAKKVLPVSS